MKYGGEGRLLFIGMNRGRSPQLGQGRATLGQQATLAAGPAWTSGHARNAAALDGLQAFRHALKGHLAVRALRTPLSSRDRNAARTMNQAHARLNLIAMLATGSTGNKKFNLANALQRRAIGWIHFRWYHLLLSLIFNPDVVYHRKRG